jgi:SAM-dependent methyltransferase
MENTGIPKEFNPPITHPYYFIRKALFKAISENANQLQGNMMDFGCGSKPYKALFGHLKSYVGVDYDGDGHSHENEQIEVYYDGNTIPFEANHFDSILCSEVFEHLFNLEEILLELHRVLKSGGKLLVTCPFVWNLHEAPIDYARYTPFALRHLFEKAGFKILKAERGGTFMEVITQLKNVFAMGAVFGRYNEKYYTNRWPFRIFQPIYITLNNISGFILNKILPKRYDSYFINVFLVEKN